MNSLVHYFFLDNEVVIHKLIEPFHLAKVSYLNSSEIFFFFFNYISTEKDYQESSLSIVVLGGA